MTLVRSDDLSTWSTSELVAAFQREAGQMNQAAVWTLRHAIRAGEALTALKARVPSGEWLEWLKENLQLGKSKAETYMRLAYHQHSLPAIDNVGIVQASRYLRGLESVPTNRSHNKTPPEIRDEAIRLSGEGLSARDVGGLLGLSHQTVLRFLSPELEQRRFETQKRSKQKRRDADRALREQQRRDAREQAAKKAGGALAEAYSTLRVATLALDAAVGESEGPNRVKLREALGFAYKAEDRIVEVLGVS